jgi:hypothetical protein
MLLVGDIGSVIDPLSSQGVYKALCAAVSAAVVINTCLKKPELEATALDFFDEEEKRTYDGYSAGSVATFRAEQRWCDRPFWKKRHELTAWDLTPRAFSPELANAIETGRALEVKLQNSRGTKIEKRPTMSGPFVELVEYVVSESFSYGYRGGYATAILDIHRSLIRPKTIAEINGDRRILAYMYREGLVETV